MAEYLRRHPCPVAAYRTHGHGRRRDLPEEQNVPVYMIFGDATLKQMLDARPMSLDTHGMAFLEVIQRHRRRHGSRRKEKRASFNRISAPSLNL